MADKARTGLFAEKMFRITEDTGKTIGQWLQGGKDERNKTLEQFELIGNDLYGIYWEDKKVELAEYISKGAQHSAEKLSEEQLQRLIDGMKRKMEPEAKVNGSS